MLATFFLIPVLFLAPFDFIHDFSASYEVSPDNTYVTVNLSWNLYSPATQMVILRGSEIVDILPGNATSWSTTEINYGEFQYTVAYRKNFPIRGYTLCLDWESEILEFGKLEWSKNNDPESGYLFWFSPTPNPIDPSIQEYQYNLKDPQAREISLKDFIENSLVIPGELVYVSICGYSFDSEGVIIIGPLSEPFAIQVNYQKEILDWAPLEQISDLSDSF